MKQNSFGNQFEKTFGNLWVGLKKQFFGEKEIFGCIKKSNQQILKSFCEI